MDLLNKLQAIYAKDDDTFVYYSTMVTEEVERIDRSIIRKLLRQEYESPVAKLLPPKFAKLHACFVTLSFDDKLFNNLGPNKVIDCMRSSLSQRKWISSYTFSIEQRSEKAGEYHGFHSHILIVQRQYKRKCEVLRELYSSFKKILSGMNYIDYKNVKSQQDYDNFNNYLQGNKEESKMPKVKVDKQFRIDNKIEDVISGANMPSGQSDDAQIGGK